MDSGLFLGLGAVAFAEFIDLADTFQNLLLPRIERMAGGTNLNRKVILSISGMNRQDVTATTGHFDFMVFRMDVGFHLARNIKRKE